MQKYYPTQAALLCLSLLIASSAQANMISKPDYQAGKTRISEAYKVDKTACKSLASNAKDICEEEAKAAEKKALADLKRNQDISQAQKTDATEKMDADYKVAMEKCDGLAGDAKTGCVTVAKRKFGKN